MVWRRGIQNIQKSLEDSEDVGQKNRWGKLKKHSEDVRRCGCAEDMDDGRGDSIAPFSSRLPSSPPP